MTRALVPDYIERLVPYKAGRPIDEVKAELGLETVYKLASNENPLGPSPRAVESLKASLGELHRYPAIGTLPLRTALAERFGLAPENVIAGSGSESIMANIMRTFLEHHDEVLTSEGTFVGFYVLCNSRGVKLNTVPLKDYHFDLEALAQAIGPHTRIVYLANPNNPTGTIFTRAEFDRFMERVPEHTLIILDEAYIEFVDPGANYPDSLLYRYDNVITLRTFSKAYGLAGQRIGYGFAAAPLIHNLLKVKLPFEPSIPAAAAGLGALTDEDFLQRTLELVRTEKPRMEAAFAAKGWRTLPTQANFLMCPLADDAEAERFTRFCLERGVIIRPLPAFGLPHCVRVTFGLDYENEAFFRILKEF
jgi:histidinol-phosphate aminotransferase